MLKNTIRILLLAAELLLLAVLVPSPALTVAERLVTPYGACVSAAALLAVLLLAGLRRQAQPGKQDGPTAAVWRVDALELAMVCIPLAFAGARLAYCLARFSFYFLEMGPLYVLRTREGGFMLYGAVAGVLLGGLLLSRRRGASVAQTLDALAAPGMLAIAVCRLGEWTAGEGVGAWVESEWLMRFPLAVCNEYGEWQLAVFLMEAVAAAAILLYCLRIRQGSDIRAETALLLYACCQVVLESLRMDSCLKIGFVRVSQVISALVILAVTALRAYRAGGTKRALLRAVPVAVCSALAGGIEWALDKTPVSNVLLYAAMIVLCALMYANGAHDAGVRRAADGAR